MSILNSLIGPVTGLLDKFIEDKDKKNHMNYLLWLRNMLRNYLRVS
jgi:hypothetical protein